MEMKSRIFGTIKTKPTEAGETVQTVEFEGEAGVSVLLKNEELPAGKYLITTKIVVECIDGPFVVVAAEAESSETWEKK